MKYDYKQEQSVSTQRKIMCWIHSNSIKAFFFIAYYFCQSCQFNNHERDSFDNHLGERSVSKQQDVVRISLKRCAKLNENWYTFTFRIFLPWWACTLPSFLSLISRDKSRTQHPIYSRRGDIKCVGKAANLIVMRKRNMFSARRRLDMWHLV